MPTDLAAPARPNHAVDLRTQLRTLWNVLDDHGAVVRRQDIDALPDDIVQALCDHEARRIRALIEGEAAGWSPGGVARATPLWARDTSPDEQRNTQSARLDLIGPAQAQQQTTNGLRRCNAGARDQRKPQR